MVIAIGALQKSDCLVILMMLSLENALFFFVLFCPSCRAFLFFFIEVEEIE